MHQLTSQPVNQSTQRRGFSLVELLVVVAIIVALLAILMPSMNRAIATAEIAQCMSQQRQIGQATLALTSDTFGQLPACWDGAFAGTAPQQYSWIGKEIFGQPPFTAAWPSEQPGALLPYMGNAEETVRKLVRCPSLAKGTISSSVGSNGFFDYTMVQAMAGAAMRNIPTTIELRNLDTAETTKVLARLYTEEDPAYGINGPFIDPGHMSVNRMGTWHLNRGGNYVAVDGSAHLLRFPRATYGPQADYFWGKAPSGAVIPVSNIGSLNYGWWNAQ